MNINDYMINIGKNAKYSAREIARATTNLKNQALLNIAQQLIDNQDLIINENNQDLTNNKGLDAALLDRLKLDSERINGMVLGIKQIVELPDPIGTITDLKYLPSGIQVGKMRVPLGVVGMIYESRPNVTIDAAALCIKSGNSIILRGGSEAKYSNQAIAKCIYQGLKNAKLGQNIVQVIEPTDRAAVNQLIIMNEFVDIIIPRGGKGLMKLISDQATVPVIRHLDGICHVYIDKTADLAKAFAIAINSKTHRYGVCNAMETLLIDTNIAKQILPKLKDEYLRLGVELRGCTQCQAIFPEIIKAGATDWCTEYLAPILAIKIVAGVDDAISHIFKYGSGHTDACVTEDYSLARKFITEVDSSSVMINASTRFGDGYEYGLGAEIGISTDKLHVRGPVGLEGLTSQKYVVFGNGEIRS